MTRSRASPRRPAAHLIGACSGGIIGASALGHLAADGRLGEIASLSLLVAALDNERAGTASALVNREIAAAAVAESARRGYVDGRALEGVFTWLRPNDLVWSYVVNNYLLGKQPPAFDVLYWNHDTVRLAAGLHRDFIRLSLENSLTRPGALEVLGTPVDLGAVDLDSYIVAASTDHIIPWENAYQSTQLLGGESRFVLSTSGHIQALVNPPGEESRRSYRVAELNPPLGRRVGRAGRHAARELVARLRPVAGRTLGRAQARAQAPRQRPLQGAGQGARHLRPRCLRGERPCPPPRFRTHISATRSPRTTSTSATSSPTSSGITSSPPGASSTARCCPSSTSTGRPPSCRGR